MNYSKVFELLVINLFIIALLTLAPISLIHLGDDRVTHTLEIFVVLIKGLLFSVVAVGREPVIGLL